MLRRGIVMLEAVFAAGIVGALLLAALMLVSSVAGERRIAAERNTGQLLALSLAEEIAALPVENSLATNPDTVGRATLNTASSYDGYSESPPTDRAGVPISTAAAWTRAVEVTEVNASDPEGPEDTDGGVYRIRVTASVGGRVAGEITFYRSAAGDEAVR
ncbi:MAG: hypothetical protein AAGH71_06745 [Planctomycetota bacterium]